jgi:26S proteasome regulatory subunit N7
VSRLIEEGWRRNRLKVYSGLHLVSIPQFKRGGELFIDALSTFTATELISYNDFVALTVIANTPAPEVIQVLPELPILGDLVKNLYDCHYDKFFIALSTLPSYSVPSSNFLSLPNFSVIRFTDDVGIFSRHPRTDLVSAVSDPLTPHPLLYP